MQGGGGIITKIQSINHARWVGSDTYLKDGHCSEIWPCMEVRLSGTLHQDTLGQFACFIRMLMTFQEPDDSRDE